MDRSARRPPADKFEQRRQELAQATLRTLADLGYARTSLREIANNSAYSHGVLHYYFSSKQDLICCSIRHYKSQCATRYDDVVANASSAQELATHFLTCLTQTLREEAPLHSLWYDLRAQALFESSFMHDVVAIDLLLQNMVWRVVCRYAELAGQEPALAPDATYALLDGLFQSALLHQTAGITTAAETLQNQVSGVMPLLIRPLTPA